MGRLFYIMGKSSAGKDTIYKELAAREDLGLHPVIMYTTRPIRDKEEQGREYFFVDDARAEELCREGRVIEMRCYDTIHGIWKYFTVDDKNIDLSDKDYLGIGTLESYEKIRDYYGEDKVVPVYIQVDDGIRLQRALDRERRALRGRYEEMCRRFLADEADFSEEKLKAAGIMERFQNDGDRETCINNIAAFIRNRREKA